MKINMDIINDLSSSMQLLCAAGKLPGAEGGLALAATSVDSSERGRGTSSQVGPLKFAKKTLNR
jgi:hypothetical protein